MSFAESALEQTLVYRAWQAPFAAQKFVPVLAHNDLKNVRKVLDVACGPGTSTKFFTKSDYLGIDINPRYIQDARRRYKRNFIVADVRDYDAAPDDRFDFILVNSFLHHMNTGDVLSILAHLTSLLTADGHIHMLELVMPEERSIARLLARNDRGKFARSLTDWQDLFTQIFQPVVFEPYQLTGLGAVLWNMVYFKGKARA